MGHFMSDFERGVTAHNEAVEILKGTGWKIVTNKNWVHPTAQPDDIVIERYNTQIMVEVKTDFGRNKYGKYTGNVAVEYECNGKPSGITDNECQIWFYKAHSLTGIYWVMFSDEEIESVATRGYRTVQGGDNNLASLYLVPLPEFISIGHDITDLAIEILGGSNVQ